MKKLLFLIISTALLQTDGFAQQSTLDSLQNLLATKNDTARVHILLEISKIYNGADQEKSVAYAKKALDLSRRNFFIRGEANALKSLGMAYVKERNYPEVLGYWEKSLKIFKTMNDKAGVSNMLSNIGDIYSFQGWDAKAIEYYLLSLKAAEESGDKLTIAMALLKIGAEYYHNPTTHDKALAYYLKALPYSKEAGDKVTAGTLKIKIGEIYFEQGNHQKALSYFKDARATLKATGKKDKIAFTLINEGKVYAARGDLRKAMLYHQQAKRTAESVSANLELAQALNHIAHIYNSTGNTGAALNTYKRAQQIATELGANYELKEAYEGITKVYGMRSDYKSAFEYQSRLLALKDTLYNAETNKTINILQANYETQNKQAQIDLLTKDRELQQASLQRQRVIRNGLLVVLGLSIVLGVVLIFNFRLKVRANKLLKNKNAEIQAQKEEIARQRDHLEETYHNLVYAQEQLFQSDKMASLGQLTAGVAHEINNPINFVSAGIDSLGANLEEIMTVVNGYLALKPDADNKEQLQQLGVLAKEQEIKELIDESEQLLHSIRNGATRTKEIVKSLKNFSRLDESSLKMANLNEGIDSTLVILNNQIKDRITIVKNYGDLRNVVCYPGQMNQVFMNILSNAVQAIKDKGTITITTYTENDKAIIKIKDSGIGMTDKIKKHIFEPFFTTKDVGSGTGLGLSITYGIIEKHNGRIDVKSEPGAGTEFTISIPLLQAGIEEEMQLEREQSAQNTFEYPFK